MAFVILSILDVCQEFKKIKHINIFVTKQGDSEESNIDPIRK